MEIPKEIEIDIVDIFRKSEDVPPVVEEAISRKAKVVWMQEGVIHPEACDQAEKERIKSHDGPLHQERTPATLLSLRYILIEVKGRLPTVKWKKYNTSLP